jgi:hypothetical protein
MVGVRVPVIGVAAAVLASAFSGGGDEPPRPCRPSQGGPCVVVHREDVGEDWPFSVGSGLLACRRGEVVTFRAEDETFGLNREASRAGFPPPFRIWHWDNAEALDLRKSLKPLIERGRELC